MAHQCQVMANKHIADITRTLNVSKQVYHLCTHRNIQCRHRLIQDDKLRVRDNCSRNTDALALPPAELMRITRQAGSVETNGIQSGLRTGDTVFAIIPNLVNLKRFK